MALDPLVVDSAIKVSEEGMDMADLELKALDNYFAKAYAQIGKGYDVFLPQMPRARQSQTVPAVPIEQRR
jgi:hypothetical protein